MSGKYHVACFSSDGGIRMCGSIVKELIDYFVVVFCWVGLLHCKRAKSW